MPRSLRQILHTPLVRRLRAAGFDLTESRDVRLYPDGSLWAADEEYVHEAMRVLKGPELLLSYTVAATGHRALAPFGDTLYNLFFCGGWALQLAGRGEITLLVGPGAGSLKGTGEQELDRLPVLVSMRRRAQTGLALELAAVVRQWFRDVGSRGVFGEGGVTRLSDSLRYAGKSFAFEMDVRQSGQDTLNSLLLAIVGWGYEHDRPLYMIYLGANRYEDVFKSDKTVPLGLGA